MEERISAESLAEIARINMEKQIGEKEGLKKIDTIENEMYIERERAKADATFYKMTKEIDA